MKKLSDYSPIFAVIVTVVFGILAIVLPLAHNPVLVWSRVSANIVAPNESEYIYDVAFLNIGTTVARDVKCILSFSNGNIMARSYELKANTIGANATPIENVNEYGVRNQYGVRIDYLNPDEGGS